MNNISSMADTSISAFNIENAGYSFRLVDLTINDRNVVAYPTSAYAYHKDSRFSAQLTISDIRTRERVDDNIIRVSIHRYGSLDDIFCEEYIPDYEDDMMMLDISKSVTNLAPGRYTLCIDNATPMLPDLRLAGNGTGCYLSFYMLPFGADIEHPAVSYAKARMVQDACGHRNLVLSATISRASTAADRFDVCCFDPSLLLMSDAILAATEGKSQRRIAVTIASDYAWTQGCYTCYVRHNGVPFVKIGVAISANGNNTEVCSIEPVDDSADLYHIVKQADTVAGTEKLFAKAGYRNIKEQMARFYCAHVHNFHYRHDLDADISPCRHHVFCGTGAESEHSVIESFVESAFPLFGKAEIDIAEIIPTISVSNPMQTIKSEGCVGKSVVIVSNADHLLWQGGKAVAKALEQRVKAVDDLVYIFHATANVMSQLYAQYPTLFDIVVPANRLSFPAVTVTDAIHGIQERLRKQELKLSADAEAELAEGLARRMDNGSANAESMDFCQRFVLTAIMPRFCQRMFADGEGHRCENVSYMKTVVAEDIDWSAVDCKVSPLAESLGELNAMTGLQTVKDAVRNISMKAMFDAKRRKQGKAQCGRGTYHMIFTGNPGTGKTTVAKKLGKIFHSLDILSKGNVVVAERNSIVGRYLGQTEENMLQLLQQARGNVLFIDEAYTLCDTTDDRKDYGYRAIECLLTALSQPNPDMVVVLAGYEDDMERMLTANQGLKGRFPYRLHFADYTADELMEIAMNYIRAYDLGVAPDARQMLAGMIARQTASRERNFSNARWVEQLVDNSIIPTLSERIFMLGDADNQDVITAKDMEAVAANLPQQKVQKRIGF